MTRSPCEKCPNKLTPKNEMPCAACPDPAEYAESLGHSGLPTRKLNEMVKVEPYKPPERKEIEPMFKLKNVFKPCPGPLHNGENLPLDHFSKSTVSPDGRSKLCIQCQKKELETMPPKEKKTRGCPPGGWPKKETLPENNLCPDCGRKKAENVSDVANGYCPKWWAIRDEDAERDCKNFLITEKEKLKAAKPNIPDWIEGKIDHPSKPLPKISKNTPPAIPESTPLQNTPLKFDLSKFQKVTFDRRVMGEPMIRIGEKNEIAFNACASNEFNLMSTVSFDVYVNRGADKTEVAFTPRTDDKGVFKAQHQPSYVYFNSIKLIRELAVPAGRYPVVLVDGALIVEVGHK